LKFIYQDTWSTVIITNSPLMYDPFENSRVCKYTYFFFAATDQIGKGCLIVEVSRLCAVRHTHPEDSSERVVSWSPTLLPTQRTEAQALNIHALSRIWTRDLSEVASADLLYSLDRTATGIGKLILILSSNDLV